MIRRVRLLALLAAFLALPAAAADKGADFYKRTGTKPPTLTPAKPFAEIAASYLNGPLVGVGGGAHFANGMELGGMVLMSRQSFGGGGCVDGCLSCSVPSETSGHVGAVVTFRFP